MAEATAETRQADRDLLERFAATRRDDDREALVRRYEPLARFFVRRYRDRGMEPDDLVQVAMLGLLKAIDRFDPSVGTAFSTFAGPTIDGELKRHFRDKGWAVRVPRGLQERHLAVRDTSRRLEHTLERAPRPAEIAAELGLEVDEVLEALDVSAAYRPDSIDTPPTEDHAGLTPSTVEPGYELTEDRATVEVLLAGLPERERRILELRFFEDLTQSEIAERVGISQMHVSRLLRRTLRLLRDRV